MSLKYYNAYNNTRANTLAQSYKDDFAAMQDLTFENAPNVFYGSDPDGVEYEYIYGSNIFKPVPVIRIDNVVDYNTGLYSTDDFKVFIFKNDFAAADSFSYGSKFKWKNSTWLVTSSNSLNGICHSVEVRRCNNIARFYDEWGNKIYEPCILDVTLRFTRNNTTQPIVTSNGEQKMWLQRNERTVKIKPNRRFLFGPQENRRAWKVYASGSKDYLNTITDDDNSPSLTEIYMQFDQVDMQRDDVESGFADARIAFYSIKGTDLSGDYKIGDVIPLNFTVYKDEDVVDMPLVYSISQPDIAEIIDNTIKIYNNGSFDLSVSIKENPDVILHYSINVVADPIKNYQIKVTPNIDYVLQNKSQLFECGLYNNGALDNTIVNFDFKDNTMNVPQDKYQIDIVDGNHFIIKNKGMYMAAPVKVQCTCGECSQEFSFELRGVY